MDLVISSIFHGDIFHITLPPEDDRNQIQELIKFELRDGPHIHDQLYIQLEITREEQDSSREVLNRLANRGSPYTRIRLRRDLMENQSES